MSAGTLVVGDTAGLGSTGLLGSEGQNHQGDDIGQHVINNAGDVQRHHEIKAGVDIAQRTAEAEQQGSAAFGMNALLI